MYKILSFVLLSMVFFCCGSAQTIDSKNAPKDATLPAAEDSTEESMSKIQINRFEKEIEAFEKKDMLSRYSSNSVVFVGSSSIRMWESLAKDMSPHPVINRGFGGSTIFEVNHYFDRIITKFQPAQVLLYAGENDIALGYTADETFDAFVEFINLCKQQIPDTDIVFISMKPSPSRWQLWDQVHSANEKIRNLCLLSNKLLYVDVGKLMLTENGEPDKSIFIEDMLHMNPSGYERWTSLINPVLNQLRAKK